ncbi:MAG: diacylglycerol kinase family protein [Candidatus Uhrbacteria bacterium]|nr:diacylglycerol kinase family protein [Candidatus Uhrbacteria bacterium]
MISIKKFFKSFKYAFRGLKTVARQEQSFRIQLVGAVVIIGVMFLLPLSAWEHILLILMIAAVLVLEVINSIFERIADAMKPRLNPVVKEIKDMMAGAVLLTSVTAVIVAILIFKSYLLDFFA